MSYTGHLAVLEPHLCNWVEATSTWLGIVNICSLISNISPLQITTCSPLQGDKAWSVSSETQSETSWHGQSRGTKGAGIKARALKIMGEICRVTKCAEGRRSGEGRGLYPESKRQVLKVQQADVYMYNSEICRFRNNGIHIYIYISIYRSRWKYKSPHFHLQKWMEMGQEKWKLVDLSTWHELHKYKCSFSGQF